MSRLPLQTALWRWTKVGLVLTALDLALFRGGLFWTLTSALETSIASNWSVVYHVARTIETATPQPGTALIVGSSVVLLGVAEPLSNGVARPARLIKVATFGASATDAALLAWSARGLRPWLVIYGAASRDFGRALALEGSPVTRVFYDSSVTLDALPRAGVEDVASAWVQREWKLYRYRALARAAVEMGVREWLGRPTVATPAFAADAPPVRPEALPPEARRWFAPFDPLPAEAYAHWQRWRETRRFDDYLAYLTARGVDLHKALGGNTAANLDLDGNPQVRSLQWMLETFRRMGTRVVVAAFPENPVFKEGAGRAWADPALSDACAAMLAREASAHGARFVDLRDLLPAEEFVDALHTNVKGAERVSIRIGELVAEELACPVIFNTWVYGIFLAVVFTAYWLAPARARPAVLTAFGLFFYWYYFPPHLLLIVALTLVVFVVGRRVAPGAGPGRRAWLVLGVGGCVGLLVYYKYQGLLADAVGWVVGRPGVFRPPQLRAPLGVSFFTFEFVHYLVEVARGTFPPARLGEFGLFALFFPTLICGPIKRFGDFRAQEHAAEPLDGADVNAGLERIVFGLAKKTLVADLVANFTAGVFDRPDTHTWAVLWLAVYAYALQIYCDFAGYSDIAIGSARLLGYRVPENFDWPYLQPNIARFWRSWHMSLTSWITDYLYVPLGGSRRGEWRGYLNRFLSMTICGLWHGAAVHFAVWGMYHGIALNLFRAWERWRGPRPEPGPIARVVSTLVTFHVVCLGWVLFVCDLDRAWIVLGRLLLLRS